LFLQSQKLQSIAVNKQKKTGSRLCGVLLGLVPERTSLLFFIERTTVEFIAVAHLA